MRHAPGAIHSLLCGHSRFFWLLDNPSLVSSARQCTNVQHVLVLVKGRPGGFNLSTAWGFQCNCQTDEGSNCFDRSGLPVVNKVFFAQPLLPFYAHWRFQDACCILELQQHTAKWRDRTVLWQLWCRHFEPNGTISTRSKMLFATMCSKLVVIGVPFWVQRYDEWCWECVENVLRMCWECVDSWWGLTLVAFGTALPQGFNHSGWDCNWSHKSRSFYHFLSQLQQSCRPCQALALPCQVETKISTNCWKYRTWQLLAQRTKGHCVPCNTQNTAIPAVLWYETHTTHTTH
jgi:hypothetical protein